MLVQEWSEVPSIHQSPVEGATIIFPIIMLLQLLVPIPIRTDRSLRAVPYATYALLFLNILVQLATLHLSESELYAYQMHWGLVMDSPRLATILTHAFIHADWMHLLGNMLILWIVGTVLEAGIGSALFTLLYFASMIAAILLHNIIGRIFLPESLSMPLIGASGAIAGITGFAAFRYYHIRVHTFIAIPNFFAVPAWFPIIPIPVPFWAPFWAYAAYFGGREFIFGVTKLCAHEVGGVAHWAHLGGLALGLLTSLLLRSFQDGQREQALESSVKAVSGEVPHERSVEDLQRLLHQHPDDPELLEAMAGLALLNRQEEDGKTLYCKAISLFLRGGRADRAAIAYLNVLHNFPNAVFPLREQLSLASTLESLGHYEDAVESFTRLAEEYAQQEEAQTALLRAAQICQRQLHASARAQSLLTALLQDFPQSPWCNIARDRLRDIQRNFHA